MTATTTGTTAGAREHARAQEADAVGTVATMPTRPATGVAARRRARSTRPRSCTPRSSPAAGTPTSRSRAAPTSGSPTSPGDACAHVLAYRLDRPWERLNVADTVKVQWQVYLTAGHLLLSDQGRVLASIVGDTSGRQDALYGTTTRARNDERYGDGSAQGPTPAGRELFALAAAKHDLGRRDLPPSISFFQGVRIDADGRPVFEGSAGPGAAVTLRAEVPLLLLVANTAHPLDPRRVHEHAARGARLARDADDATPTRSGTPRRRAAAPSSTPTPT